MQIHENLEKTSAISTRELAVPLCNIQGNAVTSALQMIAG